MEAPLSSRRAASRPLIRDLGISVVIGIGVTLVAGLGSRDTLNLTSFSFGILVAVTIVALFRLLYRPARRRIDRLGGIARTAAISGLLFVAGCTGWLLVSVGIQIATGGRLVLSRQLFPVAVVGLVGVGVGLTTYAYERLLDRLSASIARLKDAEQAEREIELARELQSRLLPPPEIEGEGFRIAARNLAARGVAGDFYDVFPLSDGALGVVVADVAGKGMAAGLIMASVKAVLPLLAADRPAEETLRALNRKLAAELAPRQFVALAYARWAPDRRALHLANAGLPDPWLLTPGQPPRPLAVPGPRLPLGIRREVEYQSLEVPLDPGDRLVLLTDGPAEAPTPLGEPLGYAVLADLLAASGAAERPIDMLDGLFERVRQATGPALEDDWTALALERTGQAPQN
jgi:hypothetical protein